MFYFFYDEDKSKVLKKASKLFQSLKQKKPDASFVEIESENFNPEFLNELTASQGLFEKRVVAYLKNILTETKLEDEILQNIGAMKTSENIFIWAESKLLKKPLDLLKKNAEKSDISEAKEVKKKEEFNLFSLTDAFGNRDKKNLWKLFLKAKEKSSAEEIHGILFWQLKSIAVAEASKTAAEADMKPFVFSKAKSFAKNYTKEEIKKISAEFVEMYHVAHRGKVDFMIALEKLILSL